MKKRSRRKWVRRGRSCAEFLIGFLSVCVVWLFQSAAVLLRLVMHFIGHDDVQVAVRHSSAPTSFDDVAGLTKAKALLLRRMVQPFRHAALAKQLGIPRGGGMLLYGPPGVGKTMLAKAAATELDAEFVALTAKDLVKPSVGATQQKIGELFSSLRQKKRAILFIDEAETLFSARTGNRSVVLRGAVSQLLSEWDGFATCSNALFVLAATNLPWEIDRAFLRPGRFDQVLHVGLPDKDDRSSLLYLLLKGRAYDRRLCIAYLAEQTCGMSGADLRGLVEAASQHAFARGVAREAIDEQITMADFEAALSLVRPSVSAQQLERYTQFEQQSEVHS